MSRILQFSRTGGPEVIELNEVDPPELKGEEVLYRVEAFAINRGDLFWVADTYYNSPTFPARLGQEACGVVEAIGDAVTEFKVGDRVASLVQEDGGYCVDGEWAISPQRYLVPWHSRLTAEEGCAMWSQALTSYYPFVELSSLDEGDTVLITAASSTSGTGAVQMAKLCGAKVIGTSRGLDKREFLESLGVDEIVPTGYGSDLGQQLLELTDGTGVTAVFDTVLGDLPARYVDGLAADADVYLVGALSDDHTVSVPWLPMVRCAARFMGYSLYNYNRVDEMLARAKGFIGEAIADGRLRPVIDRVYPLEEVVDAYRYMLEGIQEGKIIIRCP